MAQMLEVGRFRDVDFRDFALQIAAFRRSISTDLLHQIALKREWLTCSLYSQPMALTTLARNLDQKREV